MSAIIKRLSLADMDRCADILRIAFDDRLPWLSGLHSTEQDRDFFRHHVFTNTEIWGAVIAGETIGFIAFRKGWIDQLYVLPDFQGQGVGDALLRVAKTVRPELQLWTFQKNRAARAFYEARGFSGIRQTDGSMNEEKEPDILYRWQRSA